MPMNLGDLFPNVEVDTQLGRLDLYEYLGSNWGIFFSHPADYTPVCTTELGTVMKLLPEFTKRNCKIIALSCDNVEDHKDWVKDVEAYEKCPRIAFPIISDTGRDIATMLGMIDPERKDRDGLPVTCRAVFVIGPDKKVKLSLLYPASTGRNFHEILRALDSLQLTAQSKVITPADWKSGDACMVPPDLSPKDAAQLFPEHKVVNLPSGKQYLRICNQPK